MSNNCLDSKTSCVDVFRMSKPQLFCKSKQCLTKALIWDLRNTSQRYLKSASKTLLRQFTKPFLRYLKGSCFENLTSAWENHCLETYTHIWKLSRKHFRVFSNQFLWISGLLLPNFRHFLGFFIQIFVIF